MLLHPESLPRQRADFSTPGLGELASAVTRHTSALGPRPVLKRRITVCQLEYTKRAMPKMMPLGLIAL
jgi:hypothetical protein